MSHATSETYHTQYVCMVYLCFREEELVCWGVMFVASLRGNKACEGNFTHQGKKGKV